MYRRFGGVSIYCPTWPCDRKCGLFHLQYLAVQHKESRGKYRETHWNQADIAQSEETNPSMIFEEIMREAARKISESYVEPPLPPPLEIRKKISTTDDLLNYPPQDTTTLQYNNPVWDDENLRHELLDSDEEHFLIGDPALISEDHDSSTDEMLLDNKHDPYSNPIHKNGNDSRIFSSDDESDHDYSNLDLSKRLSFNSDSPRLGEYPMMTRRLTRGNHFEGSLDIS